MMTIITNIEKYLDSLSVNSWKKTKINTFLLICLDIFFPGTSLYIFLRSVFRENLKKTSNR